MPNRIEISPEDKKHIKISIIGDDNIVIVKKLVSGSKGKLSVSIAGNNCSVIIDEGVYIGSRLNINAGIIHPNFGKVENTHVYIGKKTSFESADLMAANANSSIEIGERCMFSYNVNIYNTDMHPLLNAVDKNIINKAGALKIGDHVWVGYNTTILKNTIISDNCVIGWGSIVSSKYGKALSGCVIAGNPAKIVKTDITWDSNGSQGYVQNTDGKAEMSERARALFKETPRFCDVKYGKNGKVIFRFSLLKDLLKNIFQRIS